jgi:hypothetical protein
MIYVTGDTHGGLDVRNLLDSRNTAMIKEEDYLLILGDFGFLWNKKANAKENHWLDWLEGQKWTTLFLDGNHENFDRLNGLPVKEWMGGHVHEVRKKILHLMRGEIFTIDDQKIFVLGGASSHDRGPAVGEKNSPGWWKEELPCREEIQNAGRHLQAVNYKVDYILTHCLPTSLQEIITKGKFRPDALTQYLQSVYESVEYRRWYCGHYHMDRDLGQNVSVLFDRIIPLGEKADNGKPQRGKPAYVRGEEVLFHYKGKEIHGKIAVVFAFGSFKQKEEPSYNIQITEPGESGMAIQVIESDITARV